MKVSLNFTFPLDLYKAINSNNIGIVKQILERRPNLVNESETVCRGDTVSHCASRNGHLNMCLLFVNTYKIDCNVKNEDECTPLHCASLYGRLDIVNFLLKKGAAINAVNKWNQTPLLFAALCGHYRVVEFLLSKGAVANIRDIDGKSCYTQAKLRLRRNNAKMIEEYDDINDIAQIDTKIKCNKQLIENALKAIEDANQTISKASKIVAEAKVKILSLETQKKNLNPKRKELKKKIRR